MQEDPVTGLLVTATWTNDKNSILMRRWLNADSVDSLSLVWRRYGHCLGHISHDLRILLQLVSPVSLYFGLYTS